MQIGTRITYPEEAGLYDVDLLQISIYHGMNDNLRYMKQCAETCREKGIRYVIHPVMYSILDKTMFQEVKEMKDFDFILIDAPPILPVMDAVELSTHVDGVLLVYEAGKVPKMALRRARTHIQNAGGRIIGAVLNKMKAEVSPDYYKYTYTHYYGEKEKRT